MRSSSPTEWSTLLTTSLLALALSSCTIESDVPTDEEMSRYADSAPPLGEPVEFWLYTHCGVESLRLDGHWWHAKEPLYADEGNSAPPEGWDDPYQSGDLTVVSEQRVVFEAEGTEVEFVPAADDRPMRFCR